MNKDELIAEIVRLGNLLDAGQLGSAEYVDGVNRAVNVFTGDVVPVDWDGVAWLADVITPDGGGKYIGYQNGKVAVLITNSSTIISYKEAEVQLA